LDAKNGAISGFAEVGLVLGLHEGRGRVDLDWCYRWAAHYVDEILKGAKPAELLVEFLTTLELWINLKTAKALGRENSDILAYLARSQLTAASQSCQSPWCYAFNGHIDL
jgi:hypothetical protein